MTVILDGKKLAATIRKDLVESVDLLKQRGTIPCLVVLLVGDDPASHIYVRNKEKAATAIGIHSIIERLEESITEAELLKKIHDYNQDNNVHGILIQLPLPDHINSERVIAAITPSKDIDGFHPLNLGRLVQKDESIVPCTPKGIIRLLDAYHLSLEGKHVVVIGQSTIVGRPMALLALNRGATVTVCHRQTKQLEDYLRQADVIVSAAGQLNLVSASQIKDGAVVIDVGINRLENGKIAGDVDFESVKGKVSAITPVPGGVGPMTIAMLLEQTVKNAINKEKEDE